MASELAESNLKLITGKLINDIISNLNTKNGTEKVASDWWKSNKIALIGLGIAEVTTIIRNAKSRKELSKRYDELVASMSWKERIEFLKGGINELKESNSKKIKTITIIASLIELAPKILPIIMMVI